MRARENRIYILPTPGGLLFLAVIAIMVLTAATYNNNLVFMLAFFLFAVFAVAMVETHLNLKGVDCRFSSAEETFEGETLRIRFQLLKNVRKARAGLRLMPRAKGLRPDSIQAHRLKGPDQIRAVEIFISAGRMGRHSVPDMRLESRFPLGLFCAWKIFRPRGEYLVYPKPAGEEKLEPVSLSLGDDQGARQAQGDGDFGELRAYREGESFHRIAWKHYARTGQLFSKIHWGEARHFRIPWRRDLRQMSRWIKSAFEENASFEMQTLDHAIGPGRGEEHARACWRLLAETRNDST